MSGLSKNKKKKKPKRHKLELELFNIMVFFVWILKRVFFCMDSKEVWMKIFVFVF
jgi:hypothetical protein